MLKHFPGRTELLLFAVLAIICTTVVHAFAERGTGLFFVTFPVFVFAAVLGLWKAGRLRASDDVD